MHHFALAISLAALAALAAACRTAPAAPRPDPAPAASAETRPVKLGAPITTTNRVALPDIARDSKRFAGATVRTEGTVQAVCQHAGCWMEIADQDSRVHVKVAGHGFAVPRSASGRRAVVEARVLPKPDEGQCESHAQEATGRVVQVELEATGVEIL